MKHVHLSLDPPRLHVGVGPVLAVYAPGWLGLRLGRRYLYLRRLSLHRLIFSERNRHGTRRLATFGDADDWQLWLRTNARRR